MGSLSRIQTPALGNSGAELGMRNRLINSGMVIDQRNAGAAITFTNNFPYSVDRWQTAQNLAATQTLTAQQSSVVPNGNFTKSLLITTTTGAAVAAANYANVWQKVEGYNIADLGWGTAAAQPATVSFWVRSSLTGTFGFFIQNGGNNRTYMTSFTIAATNTWQFVTINVPGDTSGTWNTTNGIGAYVGFDMGTGVSGVVAASSSWQSTVAQGLSGGVQLSATTGANFYFTGMQFEKGSLATPFEFRPYGTELALCQRYYWQVSDSSNAAGFCNVSYFSATRCFGVMSFPVQMRAAPVATFSATSTFATLATTALSVSAISQYNATVNSTTFDITTAATTAGFAGFLRSSASGPAVAQYSSEL